VKSKKSRQEIEEEIKHLLLNNPLPNKIKKLKKLAMSKNVKLGKFKRLFCKKCYSLFNSKNSEIRIRDNFKMVKCKNCNKIHRWRIK
jgi:predicted Zn finger-like uncharacterized protein